MAHRRGPSVECQFAKVFAWLKAGIEQIPARLEHVPKRVLPAIPRGGDDFTKLAGAAAALAPILDLHAHAVVREHDEVVSAWCGPFCRPKRFEQTCSQRQQSE